MATYTTPLPEIDEARLDQLVTDRVPEGQQLDYKEALPREVGSKRQIEQDKLEFLADVCAFANSAGGDLIFGVKERREHGKPTGEPEELVGLPDVNVDATSWGSGGSTRARRMGTILWT